MPALAKLTRESPELALSVALLYRLILGRSPDAEGLHYYLSAAERGASLRRIAKLLFASQEYAARGLGAEWRRDLYRSAGSGERRARLFETQVGVACQLVQEPSLRARAMLDLARRGPILLLRRGSERELAAAACLDQLQKASTGGRGSTGDYVPLLDVDVDVSRVPVRLIAFYLPQFHPIPENDAWWGRGFTEWTNVSKAVPQFVGHYQPHLPGELGFYDLRVPEVQRRQIELAKKYGIGGFCYYHYWFSGRRLLDKPFLRVLADPTLDLPFCVCWANENWTRRWDGFEDDVLIGQQHSAEDDLRFIEELTPALRDTRYIRVDGRPLLVVYRPLLLPDPAATVGRWRDHCRKAGIGEIYMVMARSFDDADPRSIGFDAAVEFPPLLSDCKPINSTLALANQEYTGTVFDYSEMASQFMAREERSYPLIRAVCPGWDNEARRPGRGVTFHGASPLAYYNWLSHTLRRTVAQAERSPPLVFANAWNEWAEGAHLEPDRRFGYAFLHATASALQEIGTCDPRIASLTERSQSSFQRTHDGAVVVHLFYEDMLEDVVSHVAHAADMDVFVSVGPHVRVAAVEELISRLPRARLASFANRGRDVLPFIEHLRLLESLGYRYGCKIHTKRSPHRSDGAQLRRHAFKALLGSAETVRRARSQMESQSGVGLLAAANTILDLSDPEIHLGNKVWLDRLLTKMGRPDLIGGYEWRFVAGTMFWFSIDAVRPLLGVVPASHEFEPELGQTDGTLAHAIERLIGLQCSEAGLEIRAIE